MNQVDAPQTETQNEDEIAASESVTETGTAKRERSTISFPYGDLDDAVVIAKALHDARGGRASLDQLAAAVGTTGKSGTFRLRVATAKTFDVIDGRGAVFLTELGRRIVDPSTEAEARAEAFLRVPLYRAIYDEHRGATLPVDRGLENEMKVLGVSEKQVSKARQAFQRSAEQAGFFAHGKDRLVEPATGSRPAQAEPRKSPKLEAERFEHDDPLIIGLFRRLPPADTPWSESEQEKWLELAKLIIPAVYGSGE